MFRRSLLIILTLILAGAAFLTRGSIGSAILVFCLLMLGAAVLYQRFVTNRDEDLWQEE